MDDGLPGSTRYMTKAGARQDLGKKNVSRIMVILLYAVLFVLLYRDALTELITVDWRRDDFSYCPLVACVVLYLVWERRFVLRATPSRHSPAGAVLFLAGISLYWLGELGGEYFTLYLSLWCTGVGLLWMYMGWEKVKAVSFALFLAIAVFPLPYFINNTLMVELKLASSRMGVGMIHMMGMSAYREGNIIDLGLTQLQVVDACSGMRYLLPLVILSLLIAYWTRASLWKKALLVASSVPLAVLINGARIAGTGVMSHLWGAQAAEGFFHSFSGWLVFMVMVPGLLCEMWILKKIGPEGRRAGGLLDRKDQRPSMAEPLKAHDRDDPERPRVHLRPRMKFLQPVFIFSTLVLLFTVCASHAIEFRRSVPLERPLGTFPSEIGPWRGSHEALDPDTIRILRLSDYLVMKYHDGAGRVLELYVAYYESQQKGETTHSPETCLPGSGWEIMGDGHTRVDVGKGSLVTVNRAVVRKNGAGYIMYFWFPQRGRILTSLWQVKVYAFWDAITRQRTDGALVRVTTPIASDEDADQADARIRGFISMAAPLLENYIPR